MQDSESGRVHYCAGPKRHAWSSAADAAKCCAGYELKRTAIPEGDGVVRLELSWVAIAQPDAAQPSDSPGPHAHVGTSSDSTTASLSVTDTPANPEPDVLRLTNPNEPVPHLAFFHAARVHPEDSVEYRTALAGVLVLRLLDKSDATHDWHTAMSLVPRRIKFPEFVAVKRAVEDLPDAPIPRVLATLVRTIDDFADGRPDGRLRGVVAFAQLLEHATEWECAADVYLSAVAIIGRQPHDDDRGVLPLCYDRAGVCAQKLGELDRARGLYAAGLEVAQEVEDRYWAFRLEIALAILTFEQGNLPLADEMLAQIVAAATAANLPEIVARALHEQGTSRLSAGPG